MGNTQWLLAIEVFGFGVGYTLPEPQGYGADKEVRLQCEVAKGRGY